MAPPFFDGPVPQDPGSREMWLQEALQAVAARDVVFLDPDKGLAPPSARRNSTEHVYVHEVDAFVRSGQTVVVYHHLGRTSSHPDQMRDWAERLTHELRLEAEPQVLWYRRGTARAYFVIPASAHAATIGERLEGFRQSGWFLPSPGFKHPHFAPLPKSPGDTPDSAGSSARSGEPTQLRPVDAPARRDASSSNTVVRSDPVIAGSVTRAEAAPSPVSLSSELSHRVATDYPLPVSYRWRAALATRGGLDALWAVLNAQEVLLAYLSVMALTSARIADITIGQVDDIRHRLAKRRGGITLGDWKAILDSAVNAKAFRCLPPDHPFVEVRDFLGDAAVDSALGRLSGRRNDVSHGRGFGPGEMDGVLSAARSDLATLVQAAEFVTIYPLIEVLETRWDAIAGFGEVTYRHLKGDNPLVLASVMKVASNTIETGSLYLIDAQRVPHLLRPLLIGAECPTCGNWSTFHPDRVQRDFAVEYKSLEHGHSLRACSSTRRALEAVGFVEPAPG